MVLDTPTDVIFSGSCPEFSIMLTTHVPDMIPVIDMPWEECESVSDDVLLSQLQSKGVNNVTCVGPLRTHMAALKEQQILCWLESPLARVPEIRGFEVPFLASANDGTSVQLKLRLMFPPHVNFTDGDTWETSL